MSNTFTLTFPAIPGATSYRIYRDVYVRLTRRQQRVRNALNRTCPLYGPSRLRGTYRYAMLVKDVERMIM